MKKKPKLNARQKNFVQFYLQTLNATKAAKMAGYSQKSSQQQGSRMLLNDVVSTEIDRQLDTALAGNKTRFKYKTLKRLEKIIDSNDDKVVNTAIVTALKYFGLLDNDESDDIREIKLVVELDDRYKIKNP